jgi:DNA-binding CsgD family transcriptional regulator/MFS family permease
MLIQILKPNVSSFGYALFLAINATSIWGGAVPFLPIEFQTFDVLAVFSFVQFLAFWSSFLLCMICSYLFPRLTKSNRIIIYTLLLFVGSISLIAPLYLPTLTFALVIVGGILLGIGSASFFLLWQRVFASQAPERGNLDLIVGTGFSAIIYIVLHLIPMAVAAFTIALVFIPMSGLCLLLSTRTIDYQQPMFEDIPRQNSRAYRQIMHYQWKSTLCVGCFGFASGVARALALEDPSMALVVNFASMAGALVSALILVILWRRYTFRFDTVLSFRTIFPVIVTLFLFLPFIGTPYLRIFAGVMYMLFTFATMIMMIQCAQVSRDYGINPLFIFGFFGAIVYSLQGMGFLAGYLSSPMTLEGFQRLEILALVSLWFLAITLYLVRGHLRHDAAETAERMSGIEFIALTPDQTMPITPSKTNDEQNGARHSEGDDTSNDARGSTRDSSRDSSHDNIRDNTQHYLDRTSKRLAAIARHYRLTARETEVIELIARGNSIAHIAETLIISENTVRTHSKRGYVKLNIHKRQDLLDLLEEFS